MRILIAILALSATFVGCLFVPVPVSGAQFLFALSIMTANLIVAYFASERRNRNFYGWLAISTVVSPLIGFALAASSQTLPKA
jgi:phosphate/sulfate permease